MEPGRVFVITGPSGVGKGTLIARVREELPELELSTSATTRAPRPGEADGREYHFLDEAEFERRVQRDEFVEYATYSGNRYGTLSSEIESRIKDGRPVILEVELQGARQIRNRIPDSVEVFILPPTPEVLRERLLSRGTDDEAAIDRRLETAATELEAAGEFEHRVVNGDVEVATEQLAAVIRAELSQST